MRFILGVLSALALLGTGALVTTVASVKGHSPASLYAAATNMLSPAKTDTGVAVAKTGTSNVTMAATSTDFGALGQVPTRTPENAAQVDIAQMPDKPAPVAARTPHTRAAATDKTAAPVIAIPRAIARAETGLSVKIQAAPQLQEVVFLSSVSAQSPLPPVADTTPADPVEVLYVTGGRVNMRAGPGSRYQWVATLDRGTQLMVVEKGDRWHKVSGLVDGAIVRGWMAGNFLSPEPIQFEAANVEN